MFEFGHSRFPLYWDVLLPRILSLNINHLFWVLFSPGLYFTTLYQTDIRRVCSPEFQACEHAVCLPQCPKDLEVPILVTVAKVTFKFFIGNLVLLFFVGGKVQHSTSSDWLLYYLRKKFSLTHSRPLDISWIAYALLYCPSKRYWDGWNSLWRPELVKVRLLLSTEGLIHSVFQAWWSLALFTTMSPVPALSLALAQKLSVSSSSIPRWSYTLSIWSVTEKTTPSPHLSCLF